MLGQESELVWSQTDSLLSVCRTGLWLQSCYRPSLLWHRLTVIDLPSGSPAFALHAEVEGAGNGLSESEVGAGGFGHH